MAKQVIGLGTVPDDDTGDTLAAAFDKVNDNFTEVYAAYAPVAKGVTNGDTHNHVGGDGASLIVSALTFTATDKIAGRSTAGAGLGEEISCTAAGRALIDDAAASDQRTTLGLGTAALLTATDLPLLAGRTGGTTIIGGTAAGDALNLQGTSGNGTAGTNAINLKVGNNGNATPLAIANNGTVTLTNASIVAAAPTLKIIDSDAVDGDAGVSVSANCTTTTAGAENVDAAFSQQVAGSPFTFLSSVAGGQLVLGYGGQTAYAAKLAHGVPITPVTTTAAPAATVSGTHFTNEGDADGAIITLPTASAGLTFTAIVQAAQDLAIMANTGDTIRWGADVTAAAGGIHAATVGNVITLVAINATEWVATSMIGTWVVVS